jgi:predicted NBD/HSP70 family sugar kinase
LPFLSQEILFILRGGPVPSGRIALLNVGVRLSGTNLERAAEHNRRITLHAVRVHGAITRVALSHVTGLTAPAVANIIKRLIEEDLVVETGRLRSGRGQPGKVIKINPAARFSFGVNIDRDHFSLVLVDFLGEVMSRRSWDIPFPLPHHIAELWHANAADMLEESGADPARLSGIGVAMPDDLGSIYIPGAPPDYAQWMDVSVEEMFALPFRVPVLIENDATAAALGEQHFGSGPRFSSLIYLLISAGVGGALVLDGHVVRGAGGRSGEIGLIPTGDGALLQDFVSLSNLSRHLAASGHVPADVLAGDEACEPAVRAWLDDAVGALAPALAGACCIIDPAVVLIGSRLPAPLVDRLCAQVEEAVRRTYPTLPSRPPVRRAELSGSAPVIGAAILPFIRFYLPIADALWKGTENGDELNPVETP